MSISATIAIQDGVDWWIQFVYTDANGNPVALTSPKMEARVQAVSTAGLLYTSEGGSPTIAITQPAANTVLCSIAGATTKNKVTAESGFWDAYATDPTGKVIQLGSGPFGTTPNTSAL